MNHLKKFIITALIGTQCWASTSTLIMTAVPSSDKNKAPEISAGFNESSFDYDNKARGGLRPENKSMCYVGEASKVCALIHDYETRMNQQYHRGAHDSITVQSCTISNQSIVKAVYTLTDDYGSELNLSREIKSCK